ncbi:MAG: DUF368 domain-containing protein [Acidimicrobiia bacterium]|nr:DUF368 domain-containing protein [Acidimicrobiia bacterium]MDH3470737.1 DUF368 domain-containing protein [Acidimicrobiia bacterium]
MHYLLQAGRGFLMGAADIVPGVSGGTVALVLGIYERLVHNIRNGAAVLGWVVRGQFGRAGKRWREIEWRFLLPLLAGILIALVTLARLLDVWLEDHPQIMAAIFFGLVAGSMFIAFRLMSSWEPIHLAIVAGVGVIAFFVLGFRSDEVAEPALFAFLLGGMLAIIAMILPGISGSFILLMVGLYPAVLAAVNDRDLGRLVVFALGTIVGLAAFSTILDKLLSSHHDAVMAGLIGLMAGSLRVLWPWPHGTDTAELVAPVGGEWVGPLLLALGAAAAVMFIGMLASPPSEV